jgi:hypothetical protein
LVMKLFASSVAVTVIPASAPPSGNVITVDPWAVEIVVLSPAAIAAFTTPYGKIQSCKSRDLADVIVGVAMPFPGMRPAPRSDSFQAYSSRTV